MKKMEMVKTRNRSRSQSLAVVFTDLERKGNSHINKWPTFSYFQLLNSLSSLSSLGWHLIKKELSTTGAIADNSCQRLWQFTSITQPVIYFHITCMWTTCILICSLCGKKLKSSSTPLMITVPLTETVITRLPKPFISWCILQIFILMVRVEHKSINKWITI